MDGLCQILSIVPCLWDCTAKHSAYIRELEVNLTSLRTAMKELNSLSQDVKNRVQDAEEQQRRLRNQVTEWLGTVEAMEKEVTPVLLKGTREVENKCVGSCCPKNCRSSYKVGKKVLKLIPVVTGLIEKGQFDEVADGLIVAPVDELPVENSLVGFNSKFEEVMQSFQDKESAIIGIFGVGGVGKTALLKQLNNELSNPSHMFDLVIWIVVSKPANVGEIRNTIRNKLNIPDDVWENRNEDGKVSLIFKRLKKKKFVVLLDDIWERLDLSNVGIPSPHHGVKNGSKIVLTTRSEEVCRQMNADKYIRVDCLPSDQALILFCSQAGVDMKKTHPKMQRLVAGVASECNGLPLALITVGRAMRGKGDVVQWADAKTMLEKYPTSFPGMKDESLLQACLLENDSTECRVKMHDVIRDMALWLACDCGKKKNKFWVDVVNGDGSPASAMAKLRNAEKVFLYGKGTTLRSVAELSFCSNLLTLIIRGTKLKRLDGEPFQCMKALKVLDLSQNDNLRELPGQIGSLIHLEYLDLRHTRITLLPKEIELLKNLKFLRLNYNTITGKVISGLWSLQTFEQECVHDDWKANDAAMEREIFEGLESLKHIMDLCLVLSSTASVNFFLCSRKLQRCTKDLRLHFLQYSLPAASVLDLSAGRFVKHLEKVKIVSCAMSEMKLGYPYFGNLSEVSIVRCENLRTVSALIYVPNLSSLYMRSCPSVEELIAEDEMMAMLKETDTDSDNEISYNLCNSLFSSLTFIILLSLDNLRSICPQRALPFPALKEIEIFSCKKLRYLPLDANTANTIPPEFKIRAPMEWWKGLLWDSHETIDAFAPKYERFEVVYFRS